jgi:hypothetical protein
MSSGGAGRRAAASSVAPIVVTIGAPCVLASRRPSHSDDEQRSAKPSSVAVELMEALVADPEVVSDLVQYHPPDLVP